MPPPDNDTADAKSTKKAKAAAKHEATLGETFSFVFGCGAKVRLLFLVGLVGGILNGLVYPALAYLFSTSFSSLTGATNGLDQIKTLAYTFMEVGAFALVAATVQSWSFEIVAYHASQNFRLQWFQALLRQDCAFFDVNDIGGVAGQIGPNANKFRRGVGRKFGEGVQFATTGIGGLAYAFYANWRVAFVVLSVVPLVSVAAIAVLNLNQTKGSRAAKSYKQASGVSYSAVSAVKTVLSLNAVNDMVFMYKEATQEAFKEACSILWKQGFANGAMLGSFLLLYGILTLYGSSLIYKDMQGSGCDPSGATTLTHNTTCGSSGASVFGAMLGKS
jgi:ATP-binding cassette subfamily B (MDR/TAP) protein 1